MTSEASITGSELSEKFFREDVQPILGELFPDLEYSGALIGPGSEVLGFDDATSRDHDWGPRLILFLIQSDHANRSAAIDRLLRQKLPATCHGYPTGYNSPDSEGVSTRRPDNEGGINHRIKIVTIREYFDRLLGTDIEAELSHIDWLSFPQQVLLSIQSGRIFHDQIGLNDVRRKLDYYPRDIWLYLMASSWQRIGQEEHLAARAMMTGQNIGFSLIKSRLVKDIIWLCFLMERKYAPYAKWLEKSFTRLDCAEVMMPLLHQATVSADSKTQHDNLIGAFEHLATMHNRLSITAPIEARAREWHTRGFRAIHGGEIAKAIADTIADPEMQAISKKGLIGGIDQISDNTDVLENVSLRRALMRAALG